MDNFSNNENQVVEEEVVVAEFASEEEGKVEEPAAEFTAEEESSTELDTEFKKEDKKKEEEENSDEKNGQDPSSDKEEDSKNKEEDSKEEKPEEKEEEDDEKKKKPQYSLDEIPEYTELLSKYNQLETDYAALKEKNAELVNFKENIELDKKQEMINSFYMLSDEDKKDVVDNIKTYSLEEIEGKLAVICVRNKVSFALEEEKQDTTFNLTNETAEAGSWIAAVKETQKNM